MILPFRLLFYTPSATVVRLCTTNALIALATSWDLYLSGASEDPRMLLPAWISITTVGDLQKTASVRKLLSFVLDLDCSIPPDAP